MKQHESKLSAADRAAIAQRYKAGESMARIAVDYAVSYGTVRNALISIGADLRSGSRPARRFTASECEEMVRRYLSGESSPSIAVDFDCYTMSITRVLKRYSIERKGRRQASLKYRHNEHAFDELTPDALYWLGFLWADGCITQSRKSRSPVIQLELAKKDRAHLEKFRSFLEANHPIYRVVSSSSTLVGRGRPAVRIDISSPVLTKRMRDLGFTKNPRIPSDELAASPHFWRGMIDGDGCLSRSSAKPYVQLAGCESLIERFGRFVLNSRPDCHICVYGKGASLSLWIRRRQDALAVLHILYADAPTALDRKHQCAIEILCNSLGELHG